MFWKIGTKQVLRFYDKSTFLRINYNLKITQLIINWIKTSSIMEILTYLHIKNGLITIF